MLPVARTHPRRIEPVVDGLILRRVTGVLRQRLTYQQQRQACAEQPRHQPLSGVEQEYPDPGQAEGGADRNHSRPTATSAAALNPASDSAARPIPVTARLRHSSIDHVTIMISSTMPKVPADERTP